MHPADLCLVVAALGGAALFAVPAQAQTGGGRIEVVVDKMRNDQGALACQLFASAEGFPSRTASALATTRAPVAGGAARCTFERLPPGTYAVAVVHDENGNGMADANALGIPKEGYGVSNNRTYAMSAPRWEESRFSLAAGESRPLAITLRY